MGKSVLYLPNTWYDGPDQGPFYCPDSGIVEGFSFTTQKLGNRWISSMLISKGPGLKSLRLNIREKGTDVFGDS